MKIIVKALLELDYETNRILNVIKAEHSLKDKSEAVAYLARNFPLMAVKEPEFHHMDDGDRWILAEDIPDIDLFFSRIWLNCFVNGFGRVSGQPYKKVLSIYNGYHQVFYYGKKNSFEVGELIARRMSDNPKFAEETNRRIIEYADRLRKQAESISEKSLAELTNAELLSIYDNHNALHSEYYEWGWIPVAADMFHNNLTNYLKSVLAGVSGLKDDAKVNEAFMVLTQPTKKSLIQIEREEFLRIALMIEKDKRESGIFSELYRNFNEQEAAKFGYRTHTIEYEEKLALKASELISRISPGHFRRIKDHYDRYFYVNHMYVGKAYPIEHYLKELMLLISTHADVEKSLNELEKDFLSGIDCRNSLVAEIGLSPGELALFTAFGDFMVTKIYRRFAQIFALYKMEFVLEEIRKRLGISLIQARFMLPIEMRDALIGGKIEREVLLERTKFCAYYAEQGTEAIFIGDKAARLADGAKDTEIGKTSELSGQIRCMGRAKGPVKIIIRPLDMHKMRKGDVLVSIATDPDIVPAMKKASAIVTEQGGVTSHAAIVSRELGIPCVIGTKIATKVLRDGDIVEVDADKGLVRIVK